MFVVLLLASRMTTKKRNYLPSPRSLRSSNLPTVWEQPNPPTTAQMETLSAMIPNQLATVLKLVIAAFMMKKKGPRVKLPNSIKMKVIKMEMKIPKLKIPWLAKFHPTQKKKTPRQQQVWSLTQFYSVEFLCKNHRFAWRTNQ